MSNNNSSSRIPPRIRVSWQSRHRLHRRQFIKHLWILQDVGGQARGYPHEEGIFTLAPLDTPVAVIIRHCMKTHKWVDLLTQLQR